MSPQNDKQKPTPWQVVKSILAGLIGVQSEEARRRDFTQGNPAVYLIGGLVALVLFIVVLVVIVNMVVGAARA